MKKRLRKKKRVGEFRELGFSFELDLELTSQDDLDAFVDSMITFAEARNLGIGVATSYTRAECFATRLEIRCPKSTCCT